MTSGDGRRLPAFPCTAGSRFQPPRGATRAATHDDIAFLRRLYWSFRAQDMEYLLWPMAMKLAFIDQQFDLQHRHYVARFADADFLILLEGAEPIGRLYIDSSAEQWHIIDIGFLPQWRNLGKGQGMLKMIQQQVLAHAGSRVLLHVEHRNVRAQALYRRLGFHQIDADDTHLEMRWPERPHPIIVGALS